MSLSRLNKLVRSRGPRQPTWPDEALGRTIERECKTESVGLDFGRKPREASSCLSPMGHSTFNVNPCPCEPVAVHLFWPTDRWCGSLFCPHVFASHSHRSGPHSDSRQWQEKCRVQDGSPHGKKNLETGLSHIKKKSSRKKTKKSQCPCLKRVHFTRRGRCWLDVVAREGSLEAPEVSKDRETQFLF